MGVEPVLFKELRHTKNLLALASQKPNKLCFLTLDADFLSGRGCDFFQLRMLLNSVELELQPLNASFDNLDFISR